MSLLPCPILHFRDDFKVISAFQSEKINMRVLVLCNAVSITMIDDKMYRFVYI